MVGGGSIQTGEKSVLHPEGTLVDQVVQTMLSSHGLNISVYDRSFLKKSIGRRCSALGLTACTDYLGYLASSFTEAQALVGSLVINYSEFFRSPLAFALLEQWILPRLFETKTRRQEIRIWSAGCAGGQEPYSLAILLEQLAAMRQDPIRYRIIATDISEADLELARKGRYSEEAVANIKLKHLRQFFSRHGEFYQISPRVQEHISFSAYDLLDHRSSFPQESIFGEFDLVFCSNVLFYYRQEYQGKILRKLVGSLGQEGYLVTGETEKRVVETIDEISSVAPPAAIFRRKKNWGAL